MIGTGSAFQVLQISGCEGWGRNDSHQTDVPTGLTSVKAIAASQYYTVALKDDGTVVVWGRDDWH